MITETSSNDPGFKIINNTHSIYLRFGQCFVCRNILISTSCTSLELDRDVLFIKSNIFVSKDSRCCQGHVINARLHIDALNGIRPYKITKIPFSSTDILVLFDKFRDQFNLIRYFDFNCLFTVSNSDCYNLTGISKSNFAHLIDMLVNSNMKNSLNISIRNALGLFLTKLRLGVSNKVLTTMLQFFNPKAVSQTLRQAMLSEFVPRYIGFNNIFRQNIIFSYSSLLVTRLLSEKLNTGILWLLMVHICMFNLLFDSLYFSNSVGDIKMIVG
jgi:hypothetical protein